MKLQLPSSGPIRVLSIDGGGIRGLLPAAFLTELEAELGKPCARVFDLIAGTSTGGLLALGLARPPSSAGRLLSARDLKDVYEELGVRIFPERRQHLKVWERATPRRGLDEVLEAVLPDDPDIAAATTEVLITSYDLIERRPVIFTRGAGGGQRLAMRDVARATTAAPTYLPPFEWKDPSNGQTRSLVDGGVMANNPAQLALSAVRAAHPRRSIQILSLGTGDGDRSTPAPQGLLAPAREKIRDEVQERLIAGRTLEWFVTTPILDTIMDASSKAVDLSMERALDRSYLRVQPQIDGRLPSLDDHSTAAVEAMLDAGREAWARSKGEVLDLLSTSRESL